MFVRKALSGLVLSLFAASFASSAIASVITYNDRTSFESAITNEVTDDFNSGSYNFTNTAADMKALSNGSIGYQSTYFVTPDWNLVTSQYLCWGCNGSGEILLNDTTIGTSSGVYGFGLDIISNEGNPSYTAFVTFGDGSTQNYAMPTNVPAFWGLTSTSLIKTVQFGLANGGTTPNGYFVVDNVSIGNNPDAVPEPATLALFGLGILGLGISRKRRK